jgi:DNA-3-methyladenine glycosylase II
MPPPLAQALVVLRTDPVMKPLIDHIALPPLTPTTYVFEALCNSIVSQQLSVKAAATIYNRFTDLFPGKQPYPELIKTTDDTAFRQVGLSGQKTQYIRDAARHWLERGLHDTDWQALSDDDIMATLTAIKGVGRWTVQMMLIFDFDRPDVFPVLDLGVRDAMIRLYQPEAENARQMRVRLEDIATAWQPHRSLASRYLWTWRDQLLRNKQE